MRDHLSELAMLGIIAVTERNEGRRGGTYREYEINMDINLIIDAMSEAIDDIGVHQTVQGYLSDDTEEEMIDASVTDFGVETVTDE